MLRYGQVQVDQEGESSPILAKKSLHSYTTSPSHVVFGYHPYWNGTAWQNYNYDLLSHIAWFGLEFSSSGEIIDSHDWPITNLVNLAHSNGVKVIVTAILFNTNVEPEKVGTFLKNANSRQMAIDNLITQVNQGNADGVNIDFETVPTSAKEHFNTFIHDLTQAFHDQIPGSEVSIAMPSVDWGEVSYDYKYLSDHSDGLMIMAYGYYWSGSANAGPNSPLNSGFSSRYIRWTIDDYLTKTGGDGSQLILGLPWYGRDWPVSSTQMGAPAISSGSSILYYEAEPEAQSYGKQYNSTIESAWYNYNNGVAHQVWYDDSLSLAKKYTYAKDAGIKGVGIWALGYDGGRPELWGGLNEVFGLTTPIQESAPLPGSFSVSNVYPNPFNSSFEIVVTSKESAILTIQMHDILGAEIFHTLKPVEVGENRLNFQAISDADLGSGIYFLQVTSEHETHAQSITYLK